ncbi:MAG: hypothetical protein AAF696_23305 [Bacteroidota bacterium]
MSLFIFLKKFVKYVLPTLLYIPYGIWHDEIGNTLGKILGYQAFEEILPDASFYMSLVAAYYLYNSPFSKDYKHLLRLSIFFNYIFTYSVDDSQLIFFGLYILLVCIPILIFYLLRTFKKEKLSWADYIKLISVCLGVPVFLFDYLINLHVWGKYFPNWGFLANYHESGIISVFLPILLSAFLLSHIIMLYLNKENEAIDKNDLIEMIGKE